MPPPNLPPELLAVILADPSLRSADLARCCRVSTTFADVARPLLYREVTFCLHPTTRTRSRSNPEMSVLPSQRCRDLKNSLYKHQNLRPLIRRVTLAFGPPVEQPTVLLPTARAWSTVRGALGQVNSLVSTLEHLSLPAAYLNAVCAALLEFRQFDGLTSLRLGGLTKQAWRVLSLQTGLTEAVVDGPVEWQDPWADVEPPSFHLSSLTASCTPLNPLLPSFKFAYNRLSQSSRATLRHLTLGIPAADFPSLSLFPNLIHLTISPQDSGTATDLYTSLPSLLALCPSLTRLIIAPKFTLSPTLANQLCLVDKLGAHLPPSLLRLHLLDRNFAVAELTAILNDLADGSGLREIGYLPWYRSYKRGRRGIMERTVPGGYAPAKEDCRKREIRLVEMD